MILSRHSLSTRRCRDRLPRRLGGCTDRPSALRASVKIARRRAEPGWRAAVLDEGASRHVFRLRAPEEGGGQGAPASASGASNPRRRERRRFPSANDDEVGGLPSRQDRAPLSWTNERADTLFRL